MLPNVLGGLVNGMAVAVVSNATARALARPDVRERRAGSGCDADPRPSEGFHGPAADALDRRAEVASAGGRGTGVTRPPAPA